MKTTAIAASTALLFCLIAPVANAQDSDLDGVADALDNCSEKANPGQDDTDGDFCGNLCDADYDNSGTVGFGDFGEFSAVFSTQDEEKCHVEPIPGCTVGWLDYGYYASRYGYSPGPSGTTPGTIACP